MTNELEQLINRPYEAAAEFLRSIDYDPRNDGGKTTARLGDMLRDCRTQANTKPSAVDGAIEVPPSLTEIADTANRLHPITKEGWLMNRAAYIATKAIAWDRQNRATNTQGDSQ